jgi:hypothetical protein
MAAAGKGVAATEEEVTVVAKGEGWAVGRGAAGREAATEAATEVAETVGAAVAEAMEAAMVVAWAAATDTAAAAGWEVAPGTECREAGCSTRSSP